MTEISFGARYISPATVQKLNMFSYKPHNVAFVELSKHNPFDIMALGKIKNEWKRAKYLKYIFNNISDKNLTREFQDNVHYYAITTQTDSFERLEPEKILCVVEYEQRNTEGEIYLIQTNPKCKSNPRSMLKKFYDHYLSKLISKKSKWQPYEGAGSAMLDSIKKTYPDLVLKAYSDKEVIPFYEKNGFKRSEHDSRGMIWVPKHLQNEKTDL